MYVTFKFKAITGIGTSNGIHLLYTNIPVSIEQENAEKAMALANTIGNNDKIVGVPDVTTEKPSDRQTIVITKEGFVTSETSHLVSNQEIQSFVWAIKAGIQMHRNLTK